MAEFPLNSFIDLITFDQSILSLEKAMEQNNKEIIDLKQEINVIAQEVHQSKGTVHDLRKQVDEHELTMKELDAQAKERKARLESASNPKEYSALRHEIESIKQKQHDYEETLLDAWKLLEGAQQGLEAAAARHVQQSQELAKKITEKEQDNKQLQEQLKSLQQERPAKEKIIPQEWLDKYATMRSRVPDPVVPVNGDSCSACYYMISAPDMQALRRNKLIQCKDCYRFLYLPAMLELAQQAQQS
jgi:predicted  nucleic acid-binding Zn-ribbon protein